LKRSGQLIIFLIPDQEHSESADFRQDESCPDPESVSEFWIRTTYEI